MAECGVMGDCLYSMCKALGSISSMKEGGEKLTRVLSSKINNYCPVIIGTFNLIDCMVWNNSNMVWNNGLNSNTVSRLAPS